ncbi:MAG: MFS transporter [Kiritimatiellae bacterium]|nr:MFS transporter [Kiritimatiellia bacterium]
MSDEPSTASAPAPDTSWRRRMVLVWASQCLSIMGFSFAFPFVPFFLQNDLGVTGDGALALWISLFSFSTAVSMGLAAPFWGALADRYGRRVMLVRANFAGAVCMSLMGAVHSPGMLIFLRTLQGALTGTMTAAQAFLAGEVPPERRGLALGGLSAAVFSGSMSGAFVGGFVAHRLGYRAAFFASGILLALAGAVVLFFTRETAFVPPPRPARTAARRPFRLPPLPRVTLFVLALIALLSFIRQQDFPFLPLLVQDILGSLDAAALWTGWINATGSVAGLLAGLLAGWLADRFPAFRILLAGAVAAAILSASQAAAHSFALLFPVRFFTVFFAGLIEPTLNAVLAKRTPEAFQGRVFGWACATRSFGWALGPLVAGGIAARSLRGVFAAAGLGYALLASLALSALLFPRRSDA